MISKRTSSFDGKCTYSAAGLRPTPTRCRGSSSRGSRSRRSTAPPRSAGRAPPRRAPPATGRGSRRRAREGPRGPAVVKRACRLAMLDRRPSPSDPRVTLDTLFATLVTMRLVTRDKVHPSGPRVSGSTGRLCTAARAVAVLDSSRTTTEGDTMIRTRNLRARAPRRRARADPVRRRLRRLVRRLVRPEDSDGERPGRQDDRLRRLRRRATRGAPTSTRSSTKRSMAPASRSTT